MIGWEEGESARFCFIIALAKVHPLFFSPLGPATRSPMAYIYLEGSGVLSDLIPHRSRDLARRKRYRRPFRD